MSSNLRVAVLAMVAVAAMILSLAVWIGSWSLPSESEIRRDFLAAEPHAKISDIRLTEGDSDHIYYEVEFTRGTSSERMVCEMGARVAAGGLAYEIFDRATYPKASR